MVHDIIDEVKKIGVKNICKYARLSDKMVAVQRSDGLFDIFFESESYTVINQKPWINNGVNLLLPKRLEQYGLGFISCHWRSPHIKNFTEALKFANEELKPVTDNSKYYAEPDVY
ncbi:hypothetical protein K9M79_01780 [Candidatus Woesearchaeota archaeon]|nr:hypothetical protein [Candidatus Woesearchaeota archaeon]